MADRPILFSGPMVRALLAGTKTQTRRVAAQATPGMHLDRVGPTGWQFTGEGGLPRIPYTPRCAVGDRLYVREAWQSAAPLDDTSPRDMAELVAPPLRYEADGESVHWEAWRGHDAGRFRQGMHMPRWASRLTLVVTEVRVQRLQEISDADALAEGIAKHGRFFGLADADGDTASTASAVDAYAALWDSLNADRGYGWAANPWVAAYSFTVHRGNIDEMPA